MMIRPSEIQAAFRFAAYGFSGNPLHLQGVLFYIHIHEASKTSQSGIAPLLRYFYVHSFLVVCCDSRKFLWPRGL